MSPPATSALPGWEDWGRLLGLLVRRFRRLDLAEEALGEAYAPAAETWPTAGAPDNPAGWLPLLAVEASAHSETDDERPLELPALADADEERLRLLFLCCHEAIAAEAQVALALRLVLGVPTADLARLFLVPEPTLAARLTRAKRKIAASGIPFVLPPPGRRPAKVQAVVSAIYLTFTAAYTPPSGAAVVRVELADQAIRLARVLRTLAPPEPSADALLALLLLQHARRDARQDESGLVLLAHQDRSRWHRPEIAEGLQLLAQMPAGVAGSEALRLQAEIAAVHARAGSSAETDWSGLVTHYRALEELTGSAVVRLNRAVAEAEVDGPVAALALLEGLDQRLARSHRLPAVRAELLRRAGDVAAAATQYRLALDRCANDTERQHLEAQLRSLPT